ncbi:MAG: DEAD/DEAH box helicase, partial [Lactobacillaceae bacterium]|nr:DEAD/DEAH box helicase [Lactobacillaceae bacterium]
EVKHLELITNLIKEEFNIQGESVWSGDAQRIDKVTKMRNNQIQFLVTTTILERGVTLKDINVIILGADHYLFNENNLVQIAGRVDRGQNSLAKNIFAIVEQQNSSLKKAIKQINFMNQKALEIAGNS